MLSSTVLGQLRAPGFQVIGMRSLSVEWYIVIESPRQNYMKVNPFETVFLLQIAN